MNMVRGIKAKLGVSPIILCLLLIGSFPSPSSARDPMIINARVFIDKSGVEMITEKGDSVQNTVNTIFVEVFELLKGLDEYDVDFRLNAPVREMKDIFDDQINKEHALEIFQEWLTRKDKRSEQDDFVYLLTGPRRFGGNNDTGIAVTGAICKGETAVGLTKMTGGYRDVVSTAHQIGNLLGPDNDDGDNPRCPQEYGSVMNTPPKVISGIRFYYSLCFQKKIRKVYNAHGQVCLQAGSQTGVTITGSRMDRSKSTDDVCSNDQQCGQNKVCNQGSCVNAGSNSGTTQNTWTTQRQPTNPSRPLWETTQRQPTNPSRPQDYNPGRGIETTNQFCRKYFGGQYEHQLIPGADVCSQIVCRHAHSDDTKSIGGTIHGVYCGLEPGARACQYGKCVPLS